MYKHFFKRLFDFCIALVALIIISPILLVITIWLHFANKGAGALTSSKQGGAKEKSVRARLSAWFAPVFFFQERPGKDEKIFKIIKFKTMTDERDADGNLLPDKDRITKVGMFVRKTSIDELPQLINVLKGDMALIGPRPLLPEYLPWYTPEEMRRHEIRPGISGLAQSHGRNNLTWEETFADDVYYVDHVSLILDLKIIFKTVINVLSHKDVTVIQPGGTIGRLDLARAALKEQQSDNS